jgi:uncharacterized protein YkwD
MKGKLSMLSNVPNLLKLTGLCMVFLLMGSGCGDDCPYGLHEVDGECVSVCGPDGYLGADELCYHYETDDNSDDDGSDDDGTDAGSIDDGTAAGSVDSTDDGSTDNSTDDSPDDDNNNPPVLPVDAECTDAASCAELARSAVDLINQLRVDEGGCDPNSLVWDEQLEAVALECAILMNETGDISACGGSLYDRLAANGYEDFRDAGENYARNTDLMTALTSISRLPGSETMFDCFYNFVGVGVVTDSRGFLRICITYLYVIYL